MSPLAPAAFVVLLLGFMAPIGLFIGRRLLRGDVVLRARFMRLGGWMLAAYYLLLIGDYAIVYWYDWQFNTELEPFTTLGCTALLAGPVLTGGLVVVANAMGNNIQHSRCKHCGYDLSHSTGGPCPECGNPPPVKRASK